MKVDGTSVYVCKLSQICPDSLGIYVYIGGYFNSFKVVR